MSHDTVFSPSKASGGVHEQIESFLETVMRGMMGPHDQQAATEQAGKPGRPVGGLAKREPVDGRIGGRVARSEVTTGHLAVVGSRWLVEASELRY